jgi:hypothetical protein
MLRWIILLASIALMLNSCNRCDLDNSYTISFADSAALMKEGDAWQHLNDYQLRDVVISNMRASFKHPEEITFVTGASDFVMVLDSICTQSDVTTETVEDPCYGDHNWIYQQLHPPEEYTYELHSARLLVYAHLQDTLRNTSTPFCFAGYNGQSLTQPEPADSTDCRQYEITGEGTPESALHDAGSDCYRVVHCYIYDAIENH